MKMCDGCLFFNELDEANNANSFGPRRSNHTIKDEKEDRKAHLMIKFGPDGVG